MKILVIFILFSGMVKAAEMPTNIIVHKGLILFPIKSIYFTTESHELKYKLNISTFFENSALLINCSMSLRGICKKIEENSNCKNFAKYFDSNVKKINNDIMNIMSFDIQTKKEDNAQMQANRKKRATFCGLCQWLFGGDSRIQQLHNATVENRKLMKHSTSILNDTIKLQQKEFDRFELNVRLLGKEIEKLNMKMDKINISREISNYVQSIQAMTFEHVKLYQYLRNILDENSHSNIFDVISYEKLKNDFERILDVIPQGKKLPINITNESLHHLMRVSEVTSELINSRLEILIKIPLTGGIKFVNYRVYPIPMMEDGNVRKYETDDNFITFNKNQSKFIDFDGK